MPRTRLVCVLAILTTIFLIPTGLLAQSPSTLVSGRAVDASGRGVAHQRVELVQHASVVRTVTTDVIGDWSFAGVPPGDYVVRMNIKGHIAGVRVTVTAGQMVTGTLIVLPTAAVAPQLGVIGTLANLVSLVPAAIQTAVQSAAQVTAETETTVVSPEVLRAIVNKLDRTQQLAFVAALIDAARSPASPYNQYLSSFEALNREILAADAPLRLPPGYFPPVSGSG